MVVYGVLASLYLLAFCNSVNMDWFPTLVFSGISLIGGGIATWRTNSYFIEKWPVKGQRNWEILLAIVAGSLACLVAPYVVIIAFILMIIILVL